MSFVPCEGVWAGTKYSRPFGDKEHVGVGLNFLLGLIPRSKWRQIPIRTFWASESYSCRGAVAMRDSRGGGCGGLCAAARSPEAPRSARWRRVAWASTVLLSARASARRRREREPLLGEAGVRLPLPPETTTNPKAGAPPWFPRVALPGFSVCVPNV